ncbi:MAG: hypothetical protein OEU26_37365 [Candidatus Tectomicrobia bacterium]|nr:hypothetical protein [Candidatus Tectomicrobia bacterium]
MIRLLRWSLYTLFYALYGMGRYLVKSAKLGVQLAYLVLTLIGGFVAQLALIGQVALWCGATKLSIPGPDVLFMWLPEDWRVGTWRLLGCFGAFVWLGYILPAQQSSARVARRKRRGHPLWLAGRHAWMWALLWGPLALWMDLYMGVPGPIMAVVFGGLAITYYLYVWQGKVLPCLHEGVQHELRSWPRFPAARPVR